MFSSWSRTKTYPLTDPPMLPNLPPANLLASQSQVSQQPQFPTKSQSQSRSAQQTQQLQPVCPWAAHAPPLGQSSSPFYREAHSLSTSATAAGELFLFGGYVHSSQSASNDLYLFSTRNFSTTPLRTSGNIPTPRYAHRAVFTNTILLIWGGGGLNFSQLVKQNRALDDSIYLLNLVSREWTRIAVHGPGPGGRYYHTMTLVGSKLFVFGGRTTKGHLNDIWALDLNRLKSNPFWESYEPTPGKEKPPLRAGHVSVTTGDRIIIFGGCNAQQFFNDTWSFNISTREWTELQCTGSIPSPREGHNAVIIDDVMYVFGGRILDETYLGDLTALNLSTQRWIAFQDISPGPSRRSDHAMACDGTRVFVLGGKLSPGALGDKTKPIHVLDTKLLDYPEPDSDTVNPSKKTTLLVRKSSVSPPTRGQLHQPSSSSSDVHGYHGGSPFQKATPEELDSPISQQVTRGHNPSLNGLPSRSTGASGRPRHVSEEDDDREGSMERRAKLVTPNTPSGRETARLEDGRLIELERQLSATLVVKTERDRRIAQLTDELALKSALLEQAEANAAAAAAEAKKNAELELRELQARFDNSLLSHDHALEQAEVSAAAKKNAELEIRELQAKLDKLLVSHDHAVEQAVTNAAVAAAKAKKNAELEPRELQAKLDESLLSRDRALEQAQSALRKASCAAEANEQSQRQLTEMRAELEASKSESAAFRLRLADMEYGRSKSKVGEDTYRTPTATGPVNTDEGRVVHRLLERMQAMEAEIASLRLDEKSFERMECRNEG